MNKKITLLGPGKTSLEYVPEPGEEIIAFQEVFPHCVDHMGVIPDYWVSGDPNSYILGMRYLLENHERDHLKNIKILMPSIFEKDLSFYRMYCGTTPLMRTPMGWETFSELVGKVSSKYQVESVPTTTTKYIKLFEKNKDIKDITTPGFEHQRFMSDNVIFGTVDFDSESVIGDKYKWGLENKLTSVLLPICYHLRANSVKVYGFDYQGPRFYSPDARHPWNDESQSSNTVVDFALNLLKKWVEWKCIHGMEIFSGTKNSISLPNKILNNKR